MRPALTAAVLVLLSTPAFAETNISTSDCNSYNALNPSGRMLAIGITQGFLAPADEPLRIDGARTGEFARVVTESCAANPQRRYFEVAREAQVAAARHPGSTADDWSRLACREINSVDDASRNYAVGLFYGYNSDRNEALTLEEGWFTRWLQRFLSACQANPAANLADTAETAFDAED
jgi:hypothetical protein